MPDRSIVINTTPLISLAAANCFDALTFLYGRVIVPFEVAEEVRAGGQTGLGVAGNTDSLPTSRASCWMMTVALRLAAIFLKRSIAATVSPRW